MTLMMRPVPSSARKGSAAWLTVNVPPTWTLRTKSNASGVIFANMAGEIAPYTIGAIATLPGIGIGLALVRFFAAMHNGDVTVTVWRPVSAAHRSL